MLETHREPAPWHHTYSLLITRIPSQRLPKLHSRCIPLQLHTPGALVSIRFPLGPAH